MAPGQVITAGELQRGDVIYDQEGVAITNSNGERLIFGDSRRWRPVRALRVTHTKAIGLVTITDARDTRRRYHAGELVIIAVREAAAESGYPGRRG